MIQIILRSRAGKPRKVRLLKIGKRASAMKITILCYDKPDREGDHLLIRLLRHLHNIGCQAHFAPKTMYELGMDTKRITAYAAATETDAWIVVLLEEKGIQTGSYNYPNWENEPGGLCRMLDSLFKYTPPKAIIIDEPVLMVAAIYHLGRIDISVPK